MTRRIDAHHHLWDAATGRHPMLSAPPVERFWGNSGELPKRYTIDDFLRDAQAEDVIASVYVEAGYDPAADEAAAVQATADVYGFPQAFLTWIDLAAADAAERIAADAAHANWRGTRITAPHPGDASAMFDDPAWRRGFATLAAAEGVADIMVWPDQLRAVVALAEAFPAATIVVEHVGLIDGSESWHAGMVILAAHPNVAVKLSGMGLVNRDWSAATLRPVVERLLALFGSDRLMIGTNAPVDLVMAPYATIIARVDEAIATLPERDRAALWHDTAARLYAIAMPPREPGTTR